MPPRYWLAFIKPPAVGGGLSSGSHPVWPEDAGASNTLLFVNMTGTISLQKDLLATRFAHIEHHLFDPTVALLPWADHCPSARVSDPVVRRRVPGRPPDPRRTERPDPPAPRSRHPGSIALNPSGLRTGQRSRAASAQASNGFGGWPLAPGLLEPAPRQGARRTALPHRAAGR